MNKKLEKKIEKAKEKERIRYHKEMISKQNEALKGEKCAPENVFLSLQHVNKIYDNHVQAVYDFSLDIKEHEFIVFVGPSGCGKSTTLRMIAGLEDITYGNLFIDGKFSNYIEGRNRDIAMVFQSYALYPHLSVYENMAFALKLRHLDKSEIDARINKAAEILEIKDYLQRKPAQLSGGQCQRVALGRAIVRNSKLFLMDEPLSNLDAKLRVSMRGEIIKLHKSLNATTVYVTHDQTEAMTMADRIVIMNKGYIQQIGSPNEIFNYPNNIFVATFVGSPSMNLLNVKLKKDVLEFENGFKMKVDKERAKSIISFYEKGVEKARNELTILDDNNETRNDLLSQISSLENQVCDNAKQDKKRLAKIDELKSEFNIFEKANDKKNSILKIINEYSKILENPDEIKLIFGIRPDDIYDCASVNKAKSVSNSFELILDYSELLGNQYYLHSKLNNKEIIVTTGADIAYKSGDKVNVSFRLNKYHLFDPITEKRI